MTDLITSILILLFLKPSRIVPFKGEIKINKLELLEKVVDELREYLYEVINEKGDLLNPEVVTASKMLDSVLNTYRELLKQSKQDKKEVEESES